MLIAEGLYGKQGQRLSDDAYMELRYIFNQAKRSSTFGNGRFVRNVYEKTLNSQAIRLAKDTSSNRDLMLIIGEDVKAIIPELNALSEQKGHMEDIIQLLEKIQGTEYRLLAQKQLELLESMEE